MFKSFDYQRSQEVKDTKISDKILTIINNLTCLSQNV